MSEVADLKRKLEELKEDMRYLMWERDIDANIQSVRLIKARYPGLTPQAAWVVFFLNKAGNRGCSRSALHINMPSPHGPNAGYDRSEKILDVVVYRIRKTLGAGSVTTVGYGYILSPEWRQKIARILKT